MELNMEIIWLKMELVWLEMETKLDFFGFFKFKFQSGYQISAQTPSHRAYHSIAKGQCPVPIIFEAPPGFENRLKDNSRHQKWCQEAMFYRFLPRK